MLASAQQLITFEAIQGYNLGNIDTQNSWATTATGVGNPNISNQMVTTEDKSEGLRSLKITKETAFPGQTNPIVGAFLNNITPAITYTNFTVSFDMKITNLGASDSDFEFQTVGLNGTQSSYAIRLRFGSTGTISAAQTTGATSTFATTTGTWTANTWFRVKIVGSSTGVAYFINNTQIYSGNPLTSINFNEFRFVHDNYAGSAYIDKIAINNENFLNTTETPALKFTKTKIYPNPASDFVNINSDSTVKNILVVDVSGKVMKVNASGNQVDVRNLPVGTYILKAETKDGYFTEKFIKK